MEIFNGLVSETGIYTDLPPGDYYAFHALATVVTDGGSATLQVITYGSDDDGLNWNSYGTPINGAIATRQLNVLGGGTAVAVSPWILGSRQKARLLTSGGTIAHVRLLVTARRKKPRRPQPKPPSDCECHGSRIPSVAGISAMNELAARGASATSGLANRSKLDCSSPGSRGGGQTAGPNWRPAVVSRRAGPLDVPTPQDLPKPLGGDFPLDFFLESNHAKCMTWFWATYFNLNDFAAAQNAYDFCMCHACNTEHFKTKEDTVKLCNLAWEQWNCDNPDPANVELCKKQKYPRDKCVAEAFFNYVAGCQGCASEWNTNCGCPPWPSWTGPTG